MHPGNTYSFRGPCRIIFLFSTAFSARVAYRALDWRAMVERIDSRSSELHVCCQLAPNSGGCPGQALAKNDICNDGITRCAS